MYPLANLSFLPAMLRREAARTEDLGLHPVQPASEVIPLRQPPKPVVREDSAIEKVRTRLRECWNNSCTEPTRLSLAAGTTLWFLSTAFQPGIYSTRSIYFAMTVIMPQWAWALAWGTLSAALWWRVLDRTPRELWGLIINSAAFVLYAFSFGLTTWALGFWSPAMSAMPIMAASAGWLVWRVRHPPDSPFHV